MITLSCCQACALCSEQLVKGPLCLTKLAAGHHCTGDDDVFFCLFAFNVFGGNICTESICDVTCFPAVTATLSCFNDKATLEKEILDLNVFSSG